LMQDMNLIPCSNCTVVAKLGILDGRSICSCSNKYAEDLYILEK